jgi:hypothetical protein
MNGYDDFDENDGDDMDHDTPLDPATETALAELDRIGRHAGQALRSAVGSGGATATIAPPVSGNGVAPHLADPVPAPTHVPHGGDGDGVTPVLVDLRPARADGPRRGRRRLPLVLAAAAAMAVVAGVAVTLRDAPGEPVQVTPGEEGAPTAVIGDEGRGIWPPEVTDRVLEVASPEHTEVWDQWSLSIPPAGRHLILDLRGGDAHAAAVLPDLGSAPLQAASVDSGLYIQGSDETAVFGVVDAAVTGTGVGGVTVERPGADAVEVYVEAVEGATHNAFVGFVAGDLGPGAEVVAVDDAGTEVSRAPITPAGGEDGADGIFPDDPKAPAVSFDPDEPGDVAWGGTVTDRGLYVTMGAYGLEDSVSTVIERPGTEPLQVLATHLNGAGMGEAVPVYGLVSADAAAIVVQVPGHDPLTLQLVPIDGATHQGFGGWPTNEGFTLGDLEQAVVVAYDATGTEIARRPLQWTRYEAVPG